MKNSARHSERGPLPWGPCLSHGEAIKRWPEEQWWMMCLCFCAIRYSFLMTTACLICYVQLGYSESTDWVSNRSNPGKPSRTGCSSCSVSLSYFEVQSHGVTKAWIWVCNDHLRKKVPALSWLTHAVWAGRCFGTGMVSVVSSEGSSQTISALERYITNSATLWVDSMPT